MYHILNSDSHFLGSTLYWIYRFNKREDDFTTLKEYNDYLEEVEDMSKFF